MTGGVAEVSLAATAEVSSIDSKATGFTAAAAGVVTADQTVEAHHGAGANHVCIQVLTEDFFGVPSAQWRALADALL